MRSSIVAVAACILTVSPLGACASSGKSGGTQGEGSTNGKLSAPVTVAAVLAGAHADISVAFASAASDVQVQVSGAGGLVVTSAGTQISGAFAKGSSARTQATFTPPASQGFLVVTVTGTFNGVRASKTTTFTVGQVSAADAQKASAGVKVEAGDRIKEMPAEVK